MPESHHEPPASGQTWYAITVEWETPPGPQSELIVTRDARLTMRRTVDYLARTGKLLAGGLAGMTDDPEWVAENPPPDAASAPLPVVEEWLDQFMHHTSRPALKWHRIPAPDERPYDPRD